MIETQQIYLVFRNLRCLISSFFLYTNTYTVWYIFLCIVSHSGSSGVLSRMRRGYTNEAFLQLVATVRRAIPGVSISTDIITGEGVQCNVL